MGGEGEPLYNILHSLQRKGRIKKWSKHILILTGARTDREILRASQLLLKCSKKKKKSLALSLAIVNSLKDDNTFSSSPLRRKSSLFILLKKLEKLGEREREIMSRK